MFLQHSKVSEHSLLRNHLQACTIRQARLPQATSKQSATLQCAHPQACAASAASCFQRSADAVVILLLHSDALLLTSTAAAVTLIASI